MAKPASRSSALALVGGETLLGREIRDVFATTNFPAPLSLVASADDAAGSLTEIDNEVAIVGQLNAEALGAAKLVLLAGSPESTRKVLELGVETPIIDLTYGAEDDPRARLRAPMVEPDGYTVPEDAVHVIAHPASVAVALILNQLHPAYPIKRAVVHVFEPASERGKQGLDEMQQQTLGLLSFKGQPKEIYDAQVTFNMLARYGEEAPQTLEDAELRIDRHLATLLSASNHTPMPSLRLIQAPVFHGHSFSLWVEFEENPGVDEIERVLHTPNIDVRSSDLEPPNNAGIAGQDGVSTGAIVMDRNHTQACWIWAAADNLRLMASNAAAVARQLL